MHRVGDYQGLLARPARLSDALDLGVQPQTRPGAFQRATAKDLNLLIKGAAHSQ
jgi:hypothetical protein